MKKFELCQCIIDFQNRIKEREESFNRKLESVTVVNQAILFGNDCTGTTLSIPVEVRIENGKRIKKGIVNGIAKYCPFCGKPMFIEIE